VQPSIAKAFVDARLTGAVMADYPGDIPVALDDAYQIQDTGIALTGKAVGGWKVGRIAEPLIGTYGSNRLAGPIFSDRIVDAAAGEVPKVPVLAGFAAIEAELLLRVGRTPPQEMTLEAARDYIDEVRFGLEVASSPFPGINDHGPAVTITDFGNNFGLVLGPRIEDWRSRDLLNAPVSLSIDGKVAGEARLAQMLDGPFGAFCFLVDSLAKRGLTLAPGQWISTGAITGVHAITAGQQAEASFDGSFAVVCRTISYNGHAHKNRNGL
jgi:2-keto-4-pentenoate hydratase